MKLSQLLTSEIYCEQFKNINFLQNMVILQADVYS